VNIHAHHIVDDHVRGRHFILAHAIGWTAVGSSYRIRDRQQGSHPCRRFNMSLAESILYGCHPVIEEGPSDQHYLALIKTVLIANKKITPKRKLVFPPSDGANNAKVIASNPRRKR
jgi:hypothetical protein